MVPSLPDGGTHTRGAGRGVRRQHRDLQGGYRPRARDLGSVRHTLDPVAALHPRRGQAADGAGRHGQGRLPQRH